MLLDNAMVVITDIESSILTISFDRLLKCSRCKAQKCGGIACNIWDTHTHNTKTIQ